MTDRDAQAKPPANRPNLLPTAVLFLGAAGTYGVVAFQALLNGHTSGEEVAYLIKSLWYASGLVSPYTATDATARMPFYFYQLGFWQELQGMGRIPARMLSIGIGVINAALLFAICRRLTANTLVAAAAVFIFLATPATSFYFATATPTATVSMLHLAAIWLIVTSLGRPRPWITLLMGVLCAAMFFYRQNMLLSIVVLAPLYIAAIGRQRMVHALLLIAAIAAVMGGVLSAFPPRLGEYALRLPVISPWLSDAGLLAPNFTLIDKGTTADTTMGPAFARLNLSDLLNAFVLPYSGTLFLAVLLLAFAGPGLRVLWIAPLYFVWLVLGHYLASQGTCPRCILSYAPYFSAIGALAAALTLAMISLRARRKGVPQAPLVLIGAVLAVGLNTFAPNFATQADARAFPVPMMINPGAATELAEIETMARWISSQAQGREPILVLHSLGTKNLAALPYAVFLSGHMIPAQSIEPALSKRVINAKLGGQAREAVQAAIEEETLWSDETLARWIERDYDAIILQQDTTYDQRPLLAQITPRFNLAATIIFRGETVQLYKRKTAQ